MQIAYFDTFAGISGDMTVGALLHLGVPLEALQEELKKLPLSGYRLRAEQQVVQGITGVRFCVEVNQEAPPRSFRDIRHLLQTSPLPEKAKELALRIFTALADAEGRVHGMDPEAVHFHEIGAVDSIIDIVAVALGITTLAITEVLAAPLPLGGGIVSSPYGPLPVPAPATLELVKGLRVRLEDGEGELVTPTGAAIVATLATKEDIGEMTVEKIGYGVGSRILPDRPNLLRIVLGKREWTPHREDMVVLETNIDDLNPEFYEHVMERLYEAGARDVYLEPIQMKKGRPGILLRVIGEERQRESLSAVMFAETSTIGIRYFAVRREILPREIREVETVYGKVRVKIARGPAGESVAPEYEDCRRLAREKNVPLRQIYLAAIQAYS